MRCDLFGEAATQRDHCLSRKDDSISESEFESETGVTVALVSESEFESETGVTVAPVSESVSESETGRIAAHVVNRPSGSPQSSATLMGGRCVPDDAYA